METEAQHHLRPLVVFEHRIDIRGGSRDFYNKQVQRSKRIIASDKNVGNNLFETKKNVMFGFVVTNGASKIGQVINN